MWLLLSFTIIQFFIWTELDDRSWTNKTDFIGEKSGFKFWKCFRKILEANRRLKVKMKCQMLFDKNLKNILKSLLYIFTIYINTVHKKKQRRQIAVHKQFIFWHVYPGSIILCSQRIFYPLSNGYQDLKCDSKT